MSDSILAKFGLTQREVDQKERQKAEGERVKRERDERQYQQKLRGERATMQREDEQRAAEAERLAGLTPAQMAQHFAQAQSAPPAHGETTPGQWITRDDIRREDAQKANREREEAAERAGLSKAEANWDKAADAIDAKRRASEDQAKAAHDEALAAIREHAQRERGGLGERPTLESLEAVGP
jgi:hypothetical protein